MMPRFLPGFSSKTRDPTKKSRLTKTPLPTTSVTTHPTCYADDFDLPTYPDLPAPKPAQMSSIASRHSTPTIYPNSEGETSVYTYPTPPPKSDTPEVEPEVGIM